MLLRKVLYLLVILLTVSFNHLAVGSDKLPASRPQVILDADLDSDVDDMGALAMLLNMHKAGDIELIGVIITSDDPYAPACADAINTFYGLPDIPVGFLKNQPKLTNHSRYTKFIAHEFPNKLNSWNDAQEAITLYRKLLAKNAGESVVVVTIGHLSSLQGLLESKPDLNSPLKGTELVKEKVKKWICMGGQFPQGKEANFYRPDPQSTVYCVKHWEKEAFFCGWEAGNKVITGGGWLKDNLKPSHPLYRGYELYNNFAGRQSWDQIAVLLLTDSSEDFFTYQVGECIVHPDGSNSWQNKLNGRHKYVVLNPGVNVQTIIRFTDSLMVELPVDINY